MLFRSILSPHRRIRPAQSVSDLPERPDPGTETGGKIEDAVNLMVSGCSVEWLQVPGFESWLLV